MKHIAVFLLGLVLCIALSEAYPGSNDRYRYRPLARLSQDLRYKQRLGKYTRYSARPAQYTRYGNRYGRLEDEAVQTPEFQEPVNVFGDEIPVDVVPSFVEPAASEEVPVAVAPEESVDRPIRVLPVFPVGGDVARKPAAPSAGAYFPVNFGDISQGSVALANSYSTGENGQASSRSLSSGSANLDERLRSSFFDN